MEDDSETGTRFFIRSRGAPTQTHLVLCGRGELANQRVADGNDVVQAPLHVSRGVFLPGGEGGI